MNDEKWQNLIETVEDRFGASERRTESLEESPGEREIIIFNGPLGKIKLERTSRPMVLEKKGIVSRRIGARARVEYIYSDTEKVQKLRVYRWSDNENDWEEVSAEDFSV